MSAEEIVARLQLEPFYKSLPEIAAMTDDQIAALVRAAESLNPNNSPEPETYLAAKTKFVAMAAALGGDPEEAATQFDAQWRATRGEPV